MARKIIFQISRCFWWLIWASLYDTISPSPYLEGVWAGPEEIAESLGGDVVAMTLDQGQTDWVVLPHSLQRLVRQAVVLFYRDVSPWNIKTKVSLLWCIALKYQNINFFIVMYLSEIAKHKFLYCDASLYNIKSMAGKEEE